MWRDCLALPKWYTFIYSYIFYAITLLCYYTFLMFCFAVRGAREGESERSDPVLGC